MKGIFIILLLCLTVTPALKTSGTALPADVLRVKLVDVVDQHGFEKPLRAMTALVPVDWTATGDVQYQAEIPECGPTNPYILWQATAPDGVAALSILPVEKWTGNNYPIAQSSSCPNQQVISTQEFMLSYAKRYRPNARVLDFQINASMTRELVDYMKTNIALPAEFTQVRYEVGELLLADTVNSIDTREMLRLPVNVLVMAYNDTTFGNLVNVYLTTGLGFAVRQKAGDLDFDQAAVMMSHIREDPSWAQRIGKEQQKRNKDYADTNRKILEIQQKGNDDRARINAQGQQELDRLRDETTAIVAATGSNSSDRLRREFRESIQGVETYSDPINGGTIELDQNYSNAWQLQDGTFLLTNDANFNPGVSLQMDATRLEAIQ